MNYTKTKYEWGYMIWYLDEVKKKDLDISTAKMVMRPNTKSQEHYHSNCYEQLIIISGDLELVVDRETINLHQGESFLINPKAHHYLMNSGGNDVEIIIAYSAAARDYSIPK